MILASGSCRKDAGNSPDPAGKHRKSLDDGSSIPVENCPDFSGGFLPASCAFLQELTGNHRKKSGKFPTGILLPSSSDFRPFPAGSGEFPASFLKDSAESGSRNHLPGINSITFTSFSSDIFEHFQKSNSFLFPGESFRW